MSEHKCRQFIHKNVYAYPLETFSDSNNNNIKWPPFNNQYFYNVSESCDAAEDFDQDLDLTSLEYTQAMDYIHLHY